MYRLLKASACTECFTTLCGSGAMKCPSNGGNISLTRCVASLFAPIFLVRAVFRARGLGPNRGERLVVLGFGQVDRLAEGRDGQ